MQETQHKRVGWLDSATFDLHATGPGHPEQPARLHAIREALARRGLDSQLAYTQAPKVDLNLLARVHALEHVHNMRTIGQNGGAAVDADTRVTPFSLKQRRVRRVPWWKQPNAFLRAPGTEPSAACAHPATTPCPGRPWAFAYSTTLPAALSPR